VGHMARVNRKRNTCRVLIGNPQGHNPLEGTGVGGRIILN
jgi:hypothetical protein